MAEMPNLLHKTRVEEFLHTEFTVVHSQDHVASALGSVLPEQTSGTRVHRGEVGSGWTRRLRTFIGAGVPF